ncbi:STAS domain-containing protein [Actinomadura sp. KC06]|uniref:STAS domain-containing protein n=1 Tax=Actinomadura sp. KC06 TaxID=2530369 RepID=UPI001404DD6C|nr:STAS domain-containing protein [Actinomadura sp. KC06]
MGRRLSLYSNTLPGATLVSVEGELDGSAVEEFDAYITRVRQGPGDHLVVDLSEVTTLDRTAMHAIMRTHSHAVQHGGSVRLAGLQPLVRQVIRQTKLDERIPVHRDATAALRAALTGMPPAHAAQMK